MADGDVGILIVDDDPQILDLYSRYLEALGVVETAADAETAIALLDASPDVILLDRRMPERSGDEVLAALHQRGIDCGVILVTAIEPSGNTIDLPFHDYLTKPVTGPELRECVERVLRLSRRDLQMQQYISLLARRRVIEEEPTADHNERDDALGELDRRLAELERRIEPALGPLDREFVTKLAMGTHRDRTDANDHLDALEALFD